MHCGSGARGNGHAGIAVGGRVIQDESARGPRDLLIDDRAAVDPTSETLGARPVHPQRGAIHVAQEQVVGVAVVQGILDPPEKSRACEPIELVSRGS